MDVTLVDILVVIVQLILNKIHYIPHWWPCRVSKKPVFFMGINLDGVNWKPDFSPIKFQLLNKTKHQNYTRIA